MEGKKQQRKFTDPTEESFEYGIQKEKKEIITFFGLGSDFQFGRPRYLRLGLIHDLKQSERRAEISLSRTSVSVPDSKHT